MSQTRKRSVIESLMNQVGGLVYAIPLNWYMITHNVWSPWAYAVINTGVFLVVGTCYKFGIRRFFNWLDVRFPNGIDLHFIWFWEDREFK